MRRKFVALALLAAVCMTTAGCLFNAAQKQEYGNLKATARILQKQIEKNEKELAAFIERETVLYEKIRNKTVKPEDVQNELRALRSDILTAREDSAVYVKGIEGIVQSIKNLESEKTPWLTYLFGAIGLGLSVYGGTKHAQSNGWRRAAVSAGGMAVDLFAGIEASGSKEAKAAVGKLGNSDINRAVRLAKERAAAGPAGATPVYVASDLLAPK